MMQAKMPNEHRMVIPEAAPDGPGVAQSSDETKVVQTVLRLFEISKAARAERDKDWSDFRNLYDGKQWKKTPPSYKAAPNINIIRSTIETELPLLTDSQPGFDVLPHTPQDFDIADILSKVIQDWWARRSMDHVLLCALKDSMIVDYGILKVTWDDELESGRGDVSCSAIDPECLYVNPDCSDFDQNCDWVIERKHLPVGELKRLFPDKAEYIHGSTGDADGKDAKGKTFSGQVELVSPVDQKSDRVPSRTSASINSSDYESVEVLECWLKDYAPSDYLGDEGGEKAADGGERVYTKQTRVVTVIPGSRLLLQDAPNPYKDNRFPYVRFVDNIRPRSFSGQGEVEPLAETQRLLNKTAASIFDNLNMMSNPAWVVDDTSGVNPDDLTNAVALVVTKVAGSDVHREPAPPMPPALIEVYQLLQAVADQQSGINDVSQGRKPTGITAANALQTMQQAAQTRVRLKARNMEVSLARLGELVVSRIMQFYSAPRVVKVAGKVVWPEVFEFYVEDAPDGSGYRMHRRQYQYDSSRGNYVPEQSWGEVGQPTEGLFSVSVTGGTSLPFLRQQRGELALKLFEMQVIDAKELLDSLEWPRKEQLLQRMEQKAAQAQGPAGPGVPPPSPANQ